MLSYTMLLDKKQYISYQLFITFTNRQLNILIVKVKMHLTRTKVFGCSIHSQLGQIAIKYH